MGMAKKSPKRKSATLPRGTAATMYPPSTPAQLKRGIVRQEEAMGCAVACVGSLLGLPYPQARQRFQKAGVKGNDTKDGFSRSALLDVLKAGGLAYDFHAFGTASPAKRHRQAKELEVGSIVYVRSHTGGYRCGHYLVKRLDGWMDPLSEEPVTKLPACPRSYLQPSPT